MSMLDLALFYDQNNWTLGFWAKGSSYTIVPGRHIGLDITTRGQAKRVPALLPGTVVGIVDTGNLGHIIIQSVSEHSKHKYLSYCHMSGYNLPRVGERLYQGQLFGQVATGPKSLGPNHPNFPGTSWDGAHVHLVWHDKIKGAYTLGQNDTYGNPEDLIRNVLSTPAGIPVTPIPTEEEEDEMATPNVITVGVPTGGAGSPNQYWSMNLADYTIALINNGTQLDFRKALGIPEYINQAPAVLKGFRRIDQA